MSVCEKIESSEVTDYICISQAGHAGSHEFVDAMGFDKVVNDKPVYRDGFKYSR